MCMSIVCVNIIMFEKPMVFQPRKTEHPKIHIIFGVCKTESFTTVKIKDFEIFSGVIRINLMSINF